MKRLNLVGKKFGRLEVIKFAYTENKRSHWLCKCKCGNEVVVKRKLLINNHTKSCGCLRKEISALINKGIPRSEKIKRKISEAHKGKHHSEKTKRKLSEANKGKHLSEEHKQKISKSMKDKMPKFIPNNKGRQHSQETKNKISGAMKGNSCNYKHGLTGTKEYRSQLRAKHRARKRNQTPADASMVEIQKIYSICTLMNEISTNIKWEVDHIKPLSKGGLHHQNNLQILLAVLNHGKHNKWPLTEEEKLKYRGITLKDLKNYER
jgi:5-methylcytosine-specific restriction endonuclease McrA